MFFSKKQLSVIMVTKPVICIQLQLTSTSSFALENQKRIIFKTLFMKIFLTTIALLVATLSFAQSQTESEIKALSAKRVEWLLKGSVDSLANLYGENSITVHGNGMIRTTAEHLNDIKSGRPVYKSIDVKETTVKDFDNTAILVGKGVFNISMNGQAMSYNMVYMEVYKKENDQWKLIARQASESH